MRQAVRPIWSSLRRRVPPDQAEARLDLGDLGAAHRHAMWGRAVEFDNGSIALLADKRDMRDGHDMASMHADEQAGVELRFGLRD